MSGTGESRSELLAWLNNLLQLNIQRIEECGTGAAYCQIMDSIYLDIPMHRVRFDVSQEYDYYPNYKILQSCFARHKIEKIVYVEKLVKCRFQDNLEFLQWIKKYWMQHKDSNPYDPLQRRRSTRQVSGGNMNSREQTPNVGNSLNLAKRRPQMGQTNSNNITTMGSYNNYSNNNNLSSTTSKTTSRASMISTFPNKRVSSEKLVSLQNDLNYAKEKITNLNNEIDQYKETTNILEREREFYFGKLRDIEILVQSTQDLINEGLYKNSGTDELTKFLNRVQQILYATEEAETEYDNNPNTMNPNNDIVNNYLNDTNKNTVSNHNLNINSITHSNNDENIINHQIIHNETQLQDSRNINHEASPIAGTSQTTINNLNSNSTDNINNNLIIDEETF